MHDVLTIGTATRDVFLASPRFKAVRDSHFTAKSGFPRGQAECFALGEKVKVDKVILATGGGATNSAVTFARQGFSTAAVLKVGRDEAGRDIRRELVKERVKAKILLAEDEGSGYSIILLSPDGERTILVYLGASEELILDDVRNLPKAKCVYIAPGGIKYEVIQKVITDFAKRGLFTAINPSRAYLGLGREKLLPLLNKTKVVILNREEALTLTGGSYQDARDVFNKLDKLISGTVVMTDGPRGVWVSDGRKLYKAGIFQEKKLADRTGSGDTFGSGFVAGLLRSGGDIKYAIRLGSANATSVVEQVGAKEGILSRSQFDKEKRWRKLEIKIY